MPRPGGRKAVANGLVRTDHRRRRRSGGGHGQPGIGACAYIGDMSEIPPDGASGESADSKLDAEAEAEAKLDAEAEAAAQLEPEAEGEL